MTRSRSPCFALALAFWLLAGPPVLAGEARAPGPAKARPCSGPAVDLDPDRFACAATRRPDPRRLPLPRGVEARPQDGDGIDLAEGVSLEGRLGSRDAPAGARSLDGITTKRTAIVPRDQEPGLGKSLRHSTSDGIGLGLSFDFESR